MIVIDLETTGLEIEKDQIISIGALDFSNPTSSYYAECRVAPDVNPSEAVLAITGFSRDDLVDDKKPLLKEILHGFLGWALSRSERTLAGENPWFDSTILRRAMSQHHLGWPFGHRLVDLHSISYASMLRANRLSDSPNGESNVSLDTTLEYTGLPVRKGPHNALNDAKLEAEALSRLIFGKQLIKEYSKYGVPPDLTSVIAKVPSGILSPST